MNTIKCGICPYYSALGTRCDAADNDKIIDRKNRIICRLRRQLSERNAQDKPVAAPTANNDWMRETIQLPTAEADR